MTAKKPVIATKTKAKKNTSRTNAKAQPRPLRKAVLKKTTRKKIVARKKRAPLLHKTKENPIISPRPENNWESWQTFNPAAVLLEDRVHFLYRAIGSEGVSRLGYAVSEDGFSIDERLEFPAYEHALDRPSLSVFSYSGGSWGGAEDPRMVRVEDEDVLYMTYTICDGGGLGVGLTSIKVDDFLNKRWAWTSPELISPAGEVHKNWVIFPEKINGKYAILHSINPEIKIDYFDSLEGARVRESTRGNRPRKNCWDKWVRGVGPVPIKTKYGWLVLYSYIRGYFSSQKLFTVEAVLLDLNDPSKIIARTNVPILTPEEYYEKIGVVPNVVFPSGAVVKGDWIHLYYGAADTTCCMALVGLSSLVRQMTAKKTDAVRLERVKENPIIVPDRQHPWESRATFNPAALCINDRVHILYRAMSDDNTSVFGYASSPDGVHIDARLSEPAYTPRGSYEQKMQPGGNSGCEDPRLTRIGSTIYACYTAYNGKDQPRIALTSISVKDFVRQRWQWAPPVLISPPDISDKDAFVFPEKIGGKFMIVHRVGNAIDFAFNQTLNFKDDAWLEEYRWIGPRRGWWDDGKVGSSAPPIKTKDGWVMLYHSVSSQGVYRVGAVLLDLKNPTIILGRTDEPIFEPDVPYEKNGQIANVVFPCGNVVIGGKLFVYYGGGDQVVGVATIEMKRLLRYLKNCKY